MAFVFWSAGPSAFINGCSCHPLYPDEKIGMPAPVRARRQVLWRGQKTRCIAMPCVN